MVFFFFFGFLRHGSAVTPLKDGWDLLTAAYAVRYNLANEFCCVYSKNANVLDNVPCSIFVTNKLLMCECICLQTNIYINIY